MMGAEDAVQIYQAPDGTLALNVHTDVETVWLSADQISALFGRDKSTVSRHLRNVFDDGELEREAVVADFATTADDGKTYQVKHYNLDVIISVGYRVKSHEGVRFRRWATSVLRKYLLEGVAVNEQRLEQIKSIVRVLARSSDELVAGVADVLAGYLPGLRLLRDYDEGAFGTPTGSDPTWRLTLSGARAVIGSLRTEFPQHVMFGAERGDVLAGVIGAIYQGFGGQDVYPSVQEKAANLLYLVVKDHPLADGNKRSAAALFVTFLSQNDEIFDTSGRPLISNNALAAVTLMIAVSDPREKDLMIALVINMLEGDGS